MILTLAFIIVPAFLVSLNHVSAYKPVLLLHGVLSTHEEMEILANYITSAHPGTVVHNNNYSVVREFMEFRYFNVDPVKWHSRED